MDTIVQRMGKFCADLDYDSIPAEVIAKAKACLLNGIGIGLSCYDLDSARAAREIIKEFETATAKGANLIGDGALVSPMGAAFANGVLFHSRGQEDTHGTMHIGTMVIPASLALAQWLGSSGKELIEAVVAGYETTAALGKDLTALTTPRGFRASPIYGIFGAAAASAKLLKLDASQIADALAHAAAFAFGTTETFLTGTMEVFFENGLASRNGLLAALSARSGMKGAPSAIEGTFGFARAFADSKENLAQLGRNLGREWEILKVTFKPFPTCAFNQSSTTAMMNLIKANDLKPEQVESIEIRMSKYEATYPGIDYTGPFSTHLQTLMSAGFAMALALEDRKLHLKDMWRFDEEVLNRLAQLSRVVADEELPHSNCVLKVRLKGGQELVGELFITPDFYFYDFEQDAELIRTIHHETEVPSRVTEALIDQLRGVEEVESLDPFIHSMVFEVDK